MRLAEAIEARMGFFVRAGLLDGLPSPWQVRIASLAMLPISLSESERERARSRRTWAGQIPIRVPLQLLYAPSQIHAGTGLTLAPGQIVDHLVSVYHEDAFLAYDLQLLASHPRGLALLEGEAEGIAAGRQRWSPVLRRLVGWPGYHARLVELARLARDHDYPDPLDLDPRFCSLVGFANFSRTLPDWPERDFYGFDLDKLERRSKR